MLQRIQTVYLLATFILSTLLFFLPMGGFQLSLPMTEAQNGAETDVYSYYATGLVKETQFNEAVEAVAPVTETVAHSWALMALVIVILIVNVIGIMLYKNRVFQMRFNLLNILLNLGLYPLFFLFAWGTSQKIGEGVEVNYYLPLVFPIVNMLLTYLAIRAIGKDEALVRSLDRIR